MVLDVIKAIYNTAAFFWNVAVFVAIPVAIITIGVAIGGFLGILFVLGAAHATPHLYDLFKADLASLDLSEKENS